MIFHAGKGKRMKRRRFVAMLIGAGETDKAVKLVLDSYHTFMHSLWDKFKCMDTAWANWDTLKELVCC